MIDWTKPIRRTDNNLITGYKYVVISTTVPGAYPIAVAHLKEGISPTIVYCYDREGKQKDTGYVYWENVPEEEWIVRYTNSDDIDRVSVMIFSSAKEAKQESQYWNPMFYKNKRAVRLSDGHTENID
jgi:nickel-dependent lactate racemase